MDKNYIASELLTAAKEMTAAYIVDSFKGVVKQRDIIKAVQGIFPNANPKTLKMWSKIKNYSDNELWQGFSIEADGEVESGSVVVIVETRNDVGVRVVIRVDD